MAKLAVPGSDAVYVPEPADVHGHMARIMQTRPIKRLVVSTPMLISDAEAWCAVLNDAWERSRRNAQDDAIDSVAVASKRALAKCTDEHSRRTVTVMAGEVLKHLFGGSLDG